MQNLVFIILVAFGLSACSSTPTPSVPAKKVLKSPFPSTVPGIPIPNTHVLAKDKGVVLRGMAPLSAEDVQALVDYGVNEVLIFRNDVPGETGISSELALLSAKPEIRAVHLIPFKWKEITSFKSACQDTIKGLQLIQNSLKTKKSGLFFHCTVGEDRTGYLSGLYRIVYEGVSPKKAYKEEMCAHGYAEGDPQKPDFVVQAVHENVTVLYAKMLHLIEKGKLQKNKLDLSVCESDPAADPKFQKRLQSQLDAGAFKCERVSL